MNVFVDTNILSDAINPTPSTPQDIQRKAEASAFFAEIDRRSWSVGTSAIAVAELLCRFVASAHPNKLAELNLLTQSGLMIYAFDLPAILVAAGYGYNKTLVQAAKQPTASGSRQLARMDILIVATAKAHGFSDFYSWDKNLEPICKAMGIRLVDPCSLKPPPTQTGLSFPDQP